MSYSADIQNGQHHNRSQNSRSICIWVLPIPIQEESGVRCQESGLKLSWSLGFNLDSVPHGAAICCKSVGVKNCRYDKARGEPERSWEATAVEGFPGKSRWRCFPHVGASPSLRVRLENPKGKRHSCNREEVLVNFTFRYILLSKKPLRIYGFFLPSYLDSRRFTLYVLTYLGY